MAFTVRRGTKDQVGGTYRMLHRKIIDPVLAKLDKERAGYFTGIVEKLSEDPRTEAAPNLIFSILREALPFLPTYLPQNEFIDRLLLFVKENRQSLNKVLYSREFIEDPEALRDFANDFVSSVLALTLEKYDDGQIETGERKVYRFSGDFDESDFPFQDLDDDDL